MAEAAEIEVELVKLADGGRLLRLREAKSGLALERVLDANRPVHEQRKELGEIFKAAVARAQLITA